MGIDYYIDATRKNRPDRIKPEMYVNRVFPFLEIPVLASQLPRSSIIPLLTFSYSRKVELVECAGSNYLIYDQYMGQTLNALTRFVSEKGGQEGCVIYFFKYASERLLIHGRTEEAFKVAILYKNLKAKSKFFSNPKVDERRAFSVFIQELYLMAHEVYHCVLMLSAELRADAIDHALRFMESRQSGFSKIAIGGTKRIPGQPEDSLMSAVNNLMGVHLEPDEKLALELCCDRLALNLCATVTMSGFGARNLKDALVSCYTAYLFSRTLNFVNLDISRWLSNDSVSEEKSVLESKEMAVHMLRKAYLRKCIFYYSDLGEHPRVRTH